MKKVYVETYGCTSNQNDSEIMKGVLARDGYEIAENEKDADIIVVNTCAVKSATENKIRRRLKELGDRNLVVAGCLAEAEPEMIRNTAPRAGMLGTNRIAEISSAADGAMKNVRTELLGKMKPEKPLLPKWRSNPVAEIVEVESGCSFSCFFCGTKLAKGAAKSYSPEDIIGQISRAKEEGCREFFVTGQDVAGYRNGMNLPQLVREITSRIRGRYFLRLGMMHPANVLPILDELVEIYSSEKVYKFLHLPVQSGSDGVLEKMNRRSKASDFAEIVNAFRCAVPEITIWTDMIAGYPGESDEDFEKSMDLIRDVKPDFVNVSSYSARPKTRAAKMEQIPAGVKKGRTRDMSRLVVEMSLERNRRWIGWKGDVLIDEYNQKKGNFIGRNYAYKAVAVRGEYRLGQVVAAEMIDAASTCLIGAGI